MSQRRTWIQFLIRIPLLILVIGWLLGSVGILAYVIGTICWHHPAAIPLFVIAGWICGVLDRRRHRARRALIEQFQWRRPAADETFLEDVGILADSPQAAVALAARRVLAEVGGIPPQSIHGGDHFYPDFQKLPFYDSLGTLEVLIALEKELSIKITRQEQEQLFRHFRPESGTVADAVREVAQIWSSRPDPAEAPLLSSPPNA